MLGTSLAQTLPRITLLEFISQLPGHSLWNLLLSRCVPLPVPVTALVAVTSSRCVADETGLEWVTLDDGGSKPTRLDGV